MIKGAEKTPYEDGLFFFDFQLSADYPKAPPVCFYHRWGFFLHKWNVNPNQFAFNPLLLHGALKHYFLKVFYIKQNQPR